MNFMANIVFQFLKAVQMPAAKKTTANISFAPRPQRLGDQAYDRIKEDVVLCRLRPNAEVTEAGLAEHYDLGLAPIRAALSRLAQERLVIVVPRRGYIVAPITIQSVKELFDLRLLLEPATAKAAAGRVDVELLRKTGSGPHGKRGGARDLMFLKDNRNFHIEIARAAGNHRITRILESLLDEMERLLHLGLFESDHESLVIDHEMQRSQHEALVEALAAGDAVAAENAAIEHIVHSRQLVMRALMNGVLSLNL
jgi:DNA-binding GntR family transcriptional regulator